MDDDSNGGYKISGIVAYANNSSSKTENITFQNTYTTQTFTLTKSVEGDQGDTSTEFPFTIAISGTEGKTYTVLQDGVSLGTISGSGSMIVNLKSGQSVTVTGLTSSDSYTITETTANENGYETTITSTNTSDKIDNKAGTLNGTGAKDDAITYTNTRNTVVPTGIDQNIWPAICMIGIGGLFILVLVSRRRARR